MGDQSFWSASFKAALPKQECPGEGTIPCKCWDDGKSNMRAGLLSTLRCTAKALQCARYLQDGELQVVANWNTCPGTAPRCSCLGEQPQHKELTEAAAFREEGPRLEHPIWQDLEALRKEDAHTS